MSSPGQTGSEGGGGRGKEMGNEDMSNGVV